MPGFPLQGLRFVTQLLNHTTRTTHSTQIVIPYEDTTIPTTIYYPKKRIEGTLYFLHGMTPLGAADPRIVNLSHTFARNGYLVVTPQFATISSYQFLLDSQIHAVRASLLWLLNRPDLCPDGNLHLFTASFSSLIAMHAVTPHALISQIKSILLLGPIYNLKRCFFELLTSKTADPYAKVIILYNLLQIEAPERRDLTDLFVPFIEFFSQKSRNSLTNTAEYKKLEAQLPESEKELMLFVAQPDYDAHPLLSRFTPIVERMHQQYCYERILENFKTRFFLLHSLNDNIFSHHESEDLHLALENIGVKSKLFVTRLMDHAALRIRPSTIRDAWRLLEFISDFLHMKRP